MYKGMTNGAALRWERDDQCPGDWYIAEAGDLACDLDMNGRRVNVYIGEDATDDDLAAVSALMASLGLALPSFGIGGAWNDIRVAAPGPELGSFTMGGQDGLYVLSADF
jgi:hypothetical protein